MRDSTVLYIVAIIAIVILEVANMLTMKLDGTLLSGCVGAVVFIATKKYYKMKYHGEEKK